MQGFDNGREGRVVRRGQAVDQVSGATFDTAHVHADVVQDVGGLGRPGRQRAEARQYPQRGVRGRCFSGIEHLGEALVQRRRQ